ncbi:noelin-like [Stylophora pistillata]|nr:noelin-like [Stylophora pistillata]
MFRYLSSFCLQLVLLLGHVHCNSSVSRRFERGLHSSYGRHSHKLSVKDLALELAKKHLLKMILNEQHDLDKAKESVYILEKDRCTNLKSVGQPVTHNTRYRYYGNWMKDPLGIMGAETIFTMENYYGRVIQAFENMEKFKAGVVHKSYNLPYYFDGTGAVVYGPYLYYNRANSPYIIKYNLHTQRLEAQISVSGFNTRKNYYGWGGYSGMDLAVDEHGLWGLWGSTGNSRRLYASKIDVVINTVTQTWSLRTERMTSMGNAFVACGVIYCIDSYSGRTTINFAYDTKTSKQWNPNIQFINQYGHNSMVDYNPRERVLYAWDYRRLVTYPLTFEEK